MVVSLYSYLFTWSICVYCSFAYVCYLASLVYSLFSLLYDSSSYAINLSFFYPAFCFRSASGCRNLMCCGMFSNNNPSISLVMFAPWMAAFALNYIAFAYFYQTMKLLIVIWGICWSWLVKMFIKRKNVNITCTENSLFLILFNFVPFIIVTLLRCTAYFLRKFL